MMTIVMKVNINSTQVYEVSAPATHNHVVSHPISSHLTAINHSFKHLGNEEITSKSWNAPIRHH